MRAVAQRAEVGTVQAALRVVAADRVATALATGARRPKFDLRVSAYGTVDELNAVLPPGLPPAKFQPYAQLFADRVMPAF